MTLVEAHLSLQLLYPALSLCKAVFARDVKYNHGCSSSPAEAASKDEACNHDNTVAQKYGSFAHL